MNKYSGNESYKLYHGNMLDMLEVIEPETIDSIVTDPPYELNFMGKGWDNSGIAFQPNTWKKCYEVLKPGGYLLAFGGSRTFHRIACAIEDAGFEIRDTIMWLYGSGFPKSMDISKQIDKRADNNDEVIKAKEELGKWLKEKRGNRPQKEISKYFPSKTGGLTGCVANWEKGYNLPTWEIWVKLKDILGLDDRYDYLIEGRPSNYIEAEREVIGTKQSGCFNSQEKDRYTIGSSKSLEVDITIPSTELGKKWQGWGTALKPSFEPIIVARKPFKGSLVDNVIENGVGGINIDECRVGNNNNEKLTRKLYSNPSWKNSSIAGQGSIDDTADRLGRFPANTILTYDETDFNEVCGGFPNSKGASSQNNYSNGHIYRGQSLQESKTSLNGYREWYNDNGSASRYFYCAKASKKDRDEGLDEFNQEKVNDGRQTPIDNAFQRGETLRKNTHPTVKPTELMQYLVRLVTPNGGVILDPFNGSGSTGKAVMYENYEKKKNYKYIGIELTEEYLPISKARIEYVCNLKPEINPQLSIFDLEGE